MKLYTESWIRGRLVGGYYFRDVPARPVAVSHIPMNLGTTIKSAKILDFVEIVKDHMLRNGEI